MFFPRALSVPYSICQWSRTSNAVGKSTDGETYSDHSFPYPRSGSRLPAKHGAIQATLHMCAAPPARRHTRQDSGLNSTALKI